MPLFEENTSYRLLQILNEAPPSSSSTYTFKRKTKSGKGSPSGFGSGGPPIDKAGKPKFNKPWTGTDPAPKTINVPGANIPRQVGWGNFKGLVDPMIDFYYDMAIAGASSIPLAGKAAGVAAALTLGSPAARYATKQVIKTDLAKRYLGAGGINVAAEGSLADTVKDYVFDAIPELKTLTGSKPQFGKLGEKVAGKVGELATMGVDPLDWVTKAFGADQAAAHVNSLGASQALGTSTAGGYLSRGKRLGIY